MKCSRIQIKLANSLQLDDREATHLNSCVNCTNFANHINHIKLQRVNETPAQLRYTTLQAGLDTLENPAQPYQTILRRLVHLWQSPKTAIILTILSAILFVLLAAIQITCQQTDLACRAMALFLFIALVQNFVVALCSPLLVQKKVTQQSHG